MRTTIRLGTLALLGILVACQQKTAAPVETAATPPPPPPLEALATTRQVMLGITIPTSDVVFQVGAHAPTNDTEWEKVAANAAALAESGNLLTIGTRVVDQQEWMTHAKALIATAQEAEQAAQAKNVDKVLEVGDKIYEVCDACHKKYMAARGGV